MMDYLDDGNTDKERAAILELFGAHYFAPGSTADFESGRKDLYSFHAYLGDHQVLLDERDSLWWLDEKRNLAGVKSPRGMTRLTGFNVVIRGYTPPIAETEMARGTHLPYVNGCSTRQLINPQRLGDPTLQFLRIPSYSKEQAHHIHSTVRVVYVLSGRGVSVVGMEGKEAKTELLPGMMCVLEAMSPHHFETPQGEHLEVVPLHVFSSVGAAESSHPMMNGTHLMNQGE